MKQNLLRVISIYLAIIFTCVSHFSFAQSRDSGGASYYQGKPLESFKRDPRTEIPAYNQIIKPILDKLVAEDPGQSFHGLTHIFETILSKPWYFVKGPLEPLSQGTNGAPIKTQEGVLQSYSEVWVDKTLLNGSKMDMKKQAIVLMHELLMGIKILRFDSSKIQCLIFTAYPESCEIHSSIRPYPTKSLDELILHEDYAEVRNLTNILLDEWETLSANDINQLLIQNHFSLSQFSFPHNKMKEKIINYKDIVAAITGAQLANRLPNYYFDSQTLTKLLMKNVGKSQIDYRPIHWKNKGKCDIQFSEINEKSMKMTLKVEIKEKKKNDQKTTIQKEVTLYNNNFEYPNVNSKSILIRDWSQDDVFIHSLSSKSWIRNDRKKSKLGDKYWNVDFSFRNYSDHNLSAISFSEYVCSKEDCITWSKIEGSDINCSIQSDFIYGHDDDEDWSLRR